MSFDNKYPNRKDHRTPYYKSGRFDATCRSGGDCPWCKSNRLHKRRLQEQDADEQIRRYKETH